MVESIKELRKICKKKGVEEKGLTALYRYVSIYLLKILLYFPLNANQVSIIGVELGIIASVFFLFGNPLYFLIGGVLLFFYTLFDFCDGAMARYYKNEGGLGGLFDWSNCLPRPLVIFFLSFVFLGDFNNHNQVILLLFGFIATFFWFLNNIFWRLRKNLSKFDTMDANLEKKIFVKVSKTFDKKVTNILFNLFIFTKKIHPKFKITYLNSNKIKKDSLLFRLRTIIRKTQIAKIFPFIFIFSGMVDFLLMGPNYITFSVWIYLGISGITLFVIEEYLIKKNFNLRI